MPQPKRRRPQFEAGFLRLKKDSLRELEDIGVPPAVCYTAIKLLAAATWENGARGYLGFRENPWSIRDIASCLNMSVGTLHRHIETLTEIRFMRRVNTGYDDRDGNSVFIWHICAYDLFVPK